MDYIQNLIENKIDNLDDGIKLSDFILEQNYITKYLSKKVKATSLSLYHVLFYLSLYKTGKNVITISNQDIACFLASDRNDSTLDLRRSRFTQLIELKCIEIEVGRGGANTYKINLPSQIPACIELIRQENDITDKDIDDSKTDYYNDNERKKMILERDEFKCQYCLKSIDTKNYFIDHITPASKGGTNYKNNLISSCHDCNNRKKDRDFFEFLMENYRNGLLTQKEYLKQKTYIESVQNINNE